MGRFPPRAARRAAVTQEETFDAELVTLRIGDDETVRQTRASMSPSTAPTSSKDVVALAAAQATFGAVHDAAFGDVVTDEEEGHGQPTSRGRLKSV